MLGKFYYPALFLTEDDGITVTFPDFDYLVTCGTTWREASEKAEECLGIGIRDSLEEGKEIPSPTEMNQVEVGSGQNLAIVSVDMDKWMEDYDQKAVRRNITLPKWLDTMAKKKDINVSGICQEAIMKELHINRF